MQVRFISQPFDQQIGTVITDLLADGKTSIKILSAWGKRSGISRIRSALDDARQLGNTVEAIVGVDEQGASIEGLELLSEITTNAYVFHNPASPSRTFHPKVYILENADETNVLVGSGNLTLGGLYNNYEAASWVTASAGEEGEARVFVEDALRYYQKFRDDPEACKPLDDALIAAMQADPSLVIMKEGSRPGRSESDSGASSEFDRSVFQSSEQTLLRGPRVSTERKVAKRRTNEDSQDTSGVIDPEDVVPSPDPLMLPRGFYKKLSANDVSLTSSPGQIIVPIRFESFFEPLDVVEDKRSKGGPMKEEQEVPGVFSNGSAMFEFAGRVILYTPASNHPRQNRELRFTFLQRGILMQLNEGDYLKFIRVGTLPVTVSVETTAPGPDSFGWLGTVRQDTSPIP